MLVSVLGTLLSVFRLCRLRAHLWYYYNDTMATVYLALVQHGRQQLAVGRGHSICWSAHVAARGPASIHRTAVAGWGHFIYMLCSLVEMPRDKKKKKKKKTPTTVFMIHRTQSMTIGFSAETS